jgi:hypothetical protein
MDGILEILRSLIVHAESLSVMIGLLKHASANVCTELEQILSEIKSYKLTAQNLLDFSDDLGLMVGYQLPRSMLSHQNIADEVLEIES